MPNQPRQTLKKSLISENHTLSFELPVSERELFVKLSQHHIGLALETGITRNRQLCRTNKLFCYPVTGCLILASNTPSQRQFIEEYPKAGAIFASNKQLIQIILEWANNLYQLSKQRQAAWLLGKTTLNWERESSKLVELVESMIQGTQ